MHWLQTLDVAVFHLINGSLRNRVFDLIMPFLSGNPFFAPLLVAGAILLIWRGGMRGLLCVALMVLIVSMGDGFICNTIKHAVGRPRPSVVLSDVHLLFAKGKPSYTSMPSSHAANWFAATMVGLIYYRRSVRFMLPAAALVSFSRIYNGVHYPSDVLAGAILGAGYAAASLWLMNAIWQWAGRKWFPVWWGKLPSLLDPGLQSRAARPACPSDGFEPEKRPGGTHCPSLDVDAQWFRLGCLWIVMLLLVRLVYIAGNTLELTGDEAYQWLWSKHLALSYFSKPPLIAYTQFLGTSLWGDTAFGVRFSSPVLAAIQSFVLLRFIRSLVNARAGFYLLLIITAAPLLSAGAVLMTVDPLSVLFWTAAMISGWRAIQVNATTRQWAWVGLWMGLGFLSKYVELFQWLCWAVFFVLWPPARKQLRRPGPYLALLINLICALPVLIWNWQHDWVTIGHVADNAAIGEPAKLFGKHCLDFLSFLASEAGLLNPVFFVGTIAAVVGFWRRGRQDPRLVYFFSMGAPVFLVYMLFSFHSRILPNWIAPSVLPLFCLMVAYWDMRWHLGAARLKPWLVAGLSLGLVVVIVGHNTELIGKLTGHSLPVNRDPLHRARGWKEVARIAAAVRHELEAEGKPVFIIAGNYRLAGEISFYFPEPGAADPTNPIVYCRRTPAPVNQFYFWPGYNGRKGENAVFLREIDRDLPQEKPPPAELERDFDSVTPMGTREVLYRGQRLWVLQILACRGLR